MSLEHIVITGDYQDMGAVDHNVAFIKHTLDHITKTYDSSNTTVILNGDLTDGHALGSIHYGAMETHRHNAESVSDEELSEMMTEMGFPEDQQADLPEDEIIARKSVLVKGKKYTQEVLETIKETLTDKGFTPKLILGNNEVSTAFRVEMNNSNYEQLREIYRQVAEKVTEGEFIDDLEFREIQGIRTLSLPYFKLRFRNGTLQDELYDNPDPDKSIIYQKLKSADLQKGDHFMLALHGNVDPKEPNALNQFLKETEATIFITHGHTGKAGVTHEKNENGGEIFYINSNNFNDQGINPAQYINDLEVKDGKVVAINELEIAYKEHLTKAA